LHGFNGFRFSFFFNFLFIFIFLLKILSSNHQVVIVHIIVIDSEIVLKLGSIEMTRVIENLKTIGSSGYSFKTGWFLFT